MLNIIRDLEFTAQIYQTTGGSLLHFLRQWLEFIEIHDPNVARLLCKMIPTRCPFERNIRLLGRTFHMPPLCKLNPLYDQLMGLRFRALAFLVDKCGEDVSEYCC
jgi:hypothetical protein